MKRVTVTDLQRMRDRDEPIAMLTAYDYPTAQLADAAGVPVLLVGDSLGNVVLGYDSTVPVTVDEMIHHGKAVVRGAQRAHVVVDMPFGSFQGGWQQAMGNAARIMKETGCGSVKLEGGMRSAETVGRLVEAGIPVMGHVGLTPQSVNAFGGHKVQGKTPREAVRVIQDARALEEADAYAIVLETVPAALAHMITRRVAVPTIGIGAGPFCSGQVQVVHDMLGLYEDVRFKHARRFIEGGRLIREAIESYREAVTAGSFPAEQESFYMDERALRLIERMTPSDAEDMSEARARARGVEHGDRAAGRARRVAREANRRCRAPEVQTARSIADVRAALAGAAAPVGLVPTMGALHEGHLSLAERARGECATAVASLFVNPTQFGPNEDFDRYPRDEQRDAALLAEHGVDVLFAPAVADVYPEGHTTSVLVRGPLTERLEGAHRPGHFDGVATVVTKLFTIVAPQRAYFGQKDAQQLRVIRQFTRDLDLPVEIIGCATVREPDGLALSSRNVYLSPDEREQALALSRGLDRARGAFATGTTEAEALRGLVRAEIEAQPLATIDYVSVADTTTLEELEGAVQRPALLSLAVRFGTTRLIDNVELER